MSPFTPAQYKSYVDSNAEYRDRKARIARARRLALIRLAAAHRLEYLELYTKARAQLGL